MCFLVEVLLKFVVGLCNCPVTVEGDTLKITSQTTDSKALVVTSVRLIDTGGDVAGQISESITKLDTQGVITLWEFPLYEITSTQ